MNSAEFSDSEVVQRIKIPRENSGERIDKFLTAMFPVLSREGWQKRILDNIVLLNDLQIKPSKKLSEGDIVQFSFLKRPEPEVNKNYKILCEDNNFLIIDKPSGIPVHPSGIYFENTLTRMLESSLHRKLLPAHRLDRETSGILIFCKDKRTVARMQILFKTEKIQKEYLVLVEGDFPEEGIVAEGFLVPDQYSLVRKKRKYLTGKLSEGEYAHTSFSLICKKNSMSLLRVCLRTGRTHQIRAVLYSLGYPVVGDLIYGVDEKFYLKFIAGELNEEDLQRRRVNRCALHCHKMSWKDEDREYNIISAWPEELQNVMEYTDAICNS